MEKMTLSVRFASRDETPNPKGRIPAAYGPNGLERVEFMIAANKGEEERPLAKIASGGELSRVMLAIKSLCGGDETGKTLVFDEVDAGIGGRVAEAVGRRLRDISIGQPGPVRDALAANRRVCPDITSTSARKRVGDRTETCRTP